MEILSQSFVIQTNASRSLAKFGVVVSVRDVGYKAGTLVIGSPGLPNVMRSLQLGDAVLYQTPTNGLVEVRLSGLQPSSVEVLVTKVSPRLGIAAGLETDGGQNSPFSSDEREHIQSDLKLVLEQMAKRSDVTPEQLDLLSRKLDDVADASTRLGSKDWIMFAAGTLTNVVVGAAFAPEATKALFGALNGALGWVFQNAIRLLGT